MKNFLPLLLLLLIVVVSGCKKDYDQLANDHFNNQSLDQSFNLPLQLLNKEEAKDYSVYSKLFASSESKQITGLLFIVNHSGKELKLNPSHFTLSTNDGNFSQPENMGQELVIPAGEALGQPLLFTPINNRKLFIKTGLRGDLNKEYQLVINLHTTNITLSYNVTDSDWTDYIAQHGVEEKVRIFSPTLDTEIQKQYQLTSNKSDFVHVDESELSVAGTNLQFNIFQINDTLNLHVKIVNHGNDLLYIDPEQINSALSTQSSLIKGDMESQKLEKSQRFIKKYQFYTPTPLEDFSLSKKFVAITPDAENHSLLAEDIEFRASKL